MINILLQNPIGANEKMIVKKTLQILDSIYGRKVFLLDNTIIA